MGYDSVTINLLKIYIRFPKRLSSFLLNAYWLSRETFLPSCIFSKDYLGVKDDLLLEKFYFSVQFLTCSTSYSSLRILALEHFNFFFPSSFYRFLLFQNCLICHLIPTSMVVSSLSTKVADRDIFRFWVSLKISGVVSGFSCSDAFAQAMTNVDLPVDFGVLFSKWRSNGTWSIWWVRLLDMYTHRRGEACELWDLKNDCLKQKYFHFQSSKTYLRKHLDKAAKTKGK